MIPRMRAVAVALALLSGAAPAAFAQPAPADHATLGQWGFDLAGRDTSVKPGDNFFLYANGDYLKKLVIPADRSRFGSFDQLSELSQSRVRTVLEEASTAPPQNHDAQIIGAAYKAFMDEPRLEALDAKPLSPVLASVHAADTREKLAALMGRAPYGFLDSVFGLGIDADPKNPDRYAVMLGQGGLGLPDRDYYLKPAFAAQKAAYQTYIAQMLRMAGWPNPEANAAAVVAFETRIAEASWSKVEQRDPVKSYNPMTVEQLQTAAPGFAWRPFLDAAGLAGRDRLIVQENTAIPKIAAIYAETPVPTLQAWEAFGVIDDAAPFLSKRFVDARYAFREKALSGQLEPKPRWKRAAAAIDSGMGEAVGQVYVAKYFSPEAKAKIAALVGDLKTALAGRIRQLDWMGPETKAKALEKLSLLTVKVGYPDKWRDYSALQVSADDLFGDMERAEAFEWRRELARLDQPVDKSEWGMTPQTVNAYYNPVNNEVVFPAAILQPPFFDPDADPAVNYGGIGAVIGHEMTHGFDDEGRQFDGHGRLTDWWTAEDAAKFVAQTKRLASQYDAFEPVSGAHVNGNLTMGENIADLGGILTALDAYHVSLNGKPAPELDGLTGDQRFFLGFAQIWRSAAREDDVRKRLVTDPHSPPEDRVNGVVRNVDGWYRSFDVKPGETLYVAPDQRVRIW